MICRAIFVFLLFPFNAMAAWTPPATPDPEAILREARADAVAGRVEDSLAKHVWFFQHALDHGSSLYGVRLSNALEDWATLGKSYPPALKKLRQTRDDAAKKVIEHKADVREVFNDMLAINEQLKEEDKTVQVFSQLDREAPNVALELYDLAQPSLVNLKQFKLCGKYLDPKKGYDAIADVYRMNLKYAESHQSPAEETQWRQYAEKTFSNEVSTLVALLVVNDRTPEAKRIAEISAKELKCLGRDASIEAALQGKLPRQRPRDIVEIKGK